MAKTQGFNQYICDRCSAEIYAIDDSPKVKQWKTIHRYTSNGNQDERLLCADCSNEYRSISQKWDEQFRNFMTGKEKY